ncbi:MAG: hypothetical protein JXX28_19170 [Deltaproteobacteria bacterium]|nr:hypothetical protein [Deltaproteobacteria bacterium]
MPPTLLSFEPLADAPLAPVRDWLARALTEDLAHTEQVRCEVRGDAQIAVSLDLAELWVELALRRRGGEAALRALGWRLVGGPADLSAALVAAHSPELSPRLRLDLLRGLRLVHPALLPREVARIFACEAVHLGEAQAFAREVICGV